MDPSDSTPPCNERCKRPRDQSEIALKWWAKKHKVKAVAADLRKQVKALKTEISVLKEEVAASKSTIATLEAALQASHDEKQKAAAVLDVVEEYGGLNKIDDKSNRLLAIGSLLLSFLGIIMKRMHPVTRLRVVIDAVLDKAIFGVAATNQVLSEIYQKYILPEQKRVFSPWRILFAIDNAIGGSLNYNGIEALRTVECLGRYERGLLPSRSSIQRAAYEMHSLGQQHIPFHKKESALGEVFAFDYELFIRHILKSFSLYEVAQRESVELSITLDGAELCNGLSHLTAGVKITDHRAVDPRSGIPLSCDGLFGRIFKVQSRNYCFALKSLLGKDCKTAYKEFSDFFLFFEQLKKYGLPESALGPRIMPMEIWSPQDLSSVWKSLNTGGGARKNGTNHFCHLCPCTGNTIARFLVDENR
jgi:hypothetical protein